jgi:hypothetical protein
LIEPPKKPDFWEALQLLNGDVYIYHNGFKEEASMKDVFKCISGNCFSRLDTYLSFPVSNSAVRLNRAAIALAWFVDPDSEVINELKKLSDVDQSGMEQKG